jgi:glycosyltransferase involved in cell wall biosynthesis
MSQSRKPRKKLKISVITPSYNQGEFIEETIKSVLAQDYPGLEYIVMDACSTDSTVDVLRKYEGRLKWISRKDAGQADALRKGFGEFAAGDVLAWLNSDDLYAPGAIKLAMEFFEKNPAVDMLYGRAGYVDRLGRPIGEYPTERFDLQRLASFNFICQPSVFFRRRAYEGAGGIDSSLSYAMDYDLWIRVAKKYKVAYLDKTLSSYRLHEGSKTIGERHALESNRECFEVARKHFNRAPLNRVYVYVYLKVRRAIGNVPFVTTLVSAICAAVYYLALNRGINAADIRNLSFENIRKALR